MRTLLSRRTRTKTRLQYEALECGAASLATILDYFGRYEDLSDLRAACGVNRDGSSAGQILKAARTYGMTAKGFRMDAKNLKEGGKYPCIVFWGFNHFLVVEGFQGDTVYLSDPAQGRYKVDFEEFSKNSENEQISSSDLRFIEEESAASCEKSYEHDRSMRNRYPAYTRAVRIVLLDFTLTSLR